MSHSPFTPQNYCIICENECDGTLTIDDMEDLMGLTSLQLKSNRRIQLCDVICTSCVTLSKDDTSQQCESPEKRMRSSLSDEIPSTSENSSQAESPWDTIIVNQIPKEINCESFISLFSQYGTIEDTYFCHTGEECGTQHEKIARITFSTEEEAWKVWEASQNKLMKYDDHVLMITLASDNYSPIQNLPHDCLDAIFLYLPSIEDKSNVEKVCKRWNDVGRISWSNFTWISTDETSLGKWKMIVSRAGYSLQDVHIGQKENANEFLASVAAECVQIEYLDCTFPLDLECTLHAGKIVSKNRNLRSLQLNFTGELHERDVDLMGCRSTELEEIHLEAVNFYLALPVSMDLSRFSNLQILTLHAFRINEHKLKGVGNLKTLKELSLTNCLIHESDFEDIADLTGLEYLSLRSSMIPDASLAKILMNNGGLKYLDIKSLREITDRSFMHVQQLPQLQVLEMDALDNITDSYFGGIPKIRALSCEMCVAITDEGIRKLFNSATLDIEELRIFGCESLTVASLTIAREWSERTGKYVTISVDDDFLAECESEGWEDTDNVWVISSANYGLKELGAGDWGSDLIEWS